MSEESAQLREAKHLRRRNLYGNIFAISVVFLIVMFLFLGLGSILTGILHNDLAFVFFGSIVISPSIILILWVATEVLGIAE